MVDVVSRAKRSEMMAGIQSRNTKPEVRIRKLLHKAGYRYRLQSRVGKIKPDIVLPKWKTAIFIHGCFWHGHDSCHLYRLPKSREEFWKEKVTVNRARDRRVVETVREAGWNVITIWECAQRGRRRLDEDALVGELIAGIRRQPGELEIAGVSDRK